MGTETGLEPAIFNMVDIRSPEQAKGSVRKERKVGSGHQSWDSITRQREEVKGLQQGKVIERGTQRAQGTR